MNHIHRARRLSVTLAALAAAAALALPVVQGTPALAGRGPKWEFLPARPFTLPAAYCGFKVRVAYPVNKGYGKFVKSSDGSVILLETGAFRASYTNLSTGKAVTENISGPGKATTRPDGSGVVAIKGRTAVFLPPDLARRLGLPRVGVTAGPTTWSYAADGSLTSVSFHGHVLVDVCAALR